MALSVTTALVGSLIFSLTLVPLLAYWTLRKKVPHHDNWIVASSKTDLSPGPRLGAGQPVQSASHRSCRICPVAVVRQQTRLSSLPELNEGTIW